MIAELKNLLSDPLVASLIGIATFVAGTILTVVLAVKMKPRTRLDVAHADSEILNKQYPKLAADLEIKHKGKSVPQVTVTTMALWNSGNRTIHRTEIAEADKLRFEVVPGAKILQAYIITRTREPNATNITIDEKSERFVWIDFDYLDERDGFAAVITHSGGRDECTLKGTVRGVRQQPRRLRSNPTTHSLSTIVIMAVMVALVFVLSALEVELSRTVGAVVVVGCALLISLGPAIFFTGRLRKFPKEFREDRHLRALLPALLAG